MKVLVTGCNGYIGGHLVEELLAQGHEVVGVDHRPESWQAFGQLGPYRFVQLELAKLQAVKPLAKILEGVTAVFHLASHQPFAWEPAPFISGNVIRTATVIEAMRVADVKRLIHSSTNAVYGDVERLPVTESDVVNPRNIYEVTKYQAEMLARVYSDLGHFHTAVLRYSSVYGGRNRVGSLYYFIDMTVQGKPIRLFAQGRTMRDYVYVGDVVQANVACLACQHASAFEVFNIGSGAPMSTGSLVELIFELTGRATQIVYAEDEHWRMADLYLDIAKAQQQLHYQPRDMREGIQLYLQTLEVAARMEHQ